MCSVIHRTTIHRTARGRPRCSRSWRRRRRPPRTTTSVAPRLPGRSSGPQRRPPFAGRPFRGRSDERPPRRLDPRLPGRRIGQQGPELGHPVEGDGDPPADLAPVALVLDAYVQIGRQLPERVYARVPDHDFEALAGHTPHGRQRRERVGHPSRVRAGQPSGTELGAAEPPRRAGDYLAHAGVQQNREHRAARGALRLASVAHPDVHGMAGRSRDEPPAVMGGVRKFALDPGHLRLDRGGSWCRTERGDEAAPLHDVLHPVVPAGMG